MNFWLEEMRNDVKPFSSGNKILLGNQTDSMLFSVPLQENTRNKSGNNSNRGSYINR